MSRAITVTVFLFFALVSCSAFGQTAADSDRAEKLFTEATALVGKGSYAEACEKFAESQRLDPGIGTLYNLAVCYEHIGRLAASFQAFREVQELAHAAGKEGRANSAREHAEALHPRLSRIALTVRDRDATIKVDGVEIARDAWGFIPVDAGQHRVEASAPGKKAWSSTVTIDMTEDQELAVTVPPLEVSKARVITVTRESSSPRRTAGYIVGGVGIAGVVAATVTGIMILGDRATARQECNPKCTQDGVDAVSEGKTLSTINAVAWGVSALGVGVGAYLILSSPTRKTATPGGATLSVVPVFGDHAAGAFVRGSL
jgi:hypothetical protein